MSPPGGDLQRLPKEDLIRIKEYCGKNIVKINNPGQFAADIKKFADGFGFDFMYGPIEYVEVRPVLPPLDEIRREEYRCFRKLRNFSYQHEFRFAVEDCSDLPSPWLNYAKAWKIKLSKLQYSELLPSED